MSEQFDFYTDIYLQAIINSSHSVNLLKLSVDTFFLDVRLHIRVVQIVVEVDFVVAAHVAVQAEVVASTSDTLRS